MFLWCSQVSSAEVVVGRADIAVVKVILVGSELTITVPFGVMMMVGLTENASCRHTTIRQVVAQRNWQERNPHHVHSAGVQAKAA